MGYNNAVGCDEGWQLGLSDDELAGGRNKPLVLIIDDEPTITKTLSQVLEDESFATIYANNGVDGIEKLVEHSPELVFLDIWMPGLDGIQTLEQIKTLLPQTEVIMISGHATISNALEATRRGAFDFIEKPLDLETIIQTSKRALQFRESAINAEESLKEQGAGFNTGYMSASKSIGLDISSIPKRSYKFHPHPGISSEGIKGANLGQRTLSRSAILYGQGLHSGRKSGLILEPLPANSGIHFSLMGQAISVPAFIDYVESTSFATTVKSGEVYASTIEHLMAALHAYKVSNLLVKCNGEVPILDGSAVEFCKLIDTVGIEEQGGDWFELAVDETVRLGNQVGPERAIVESLEIEPCDSLKISYTLNYPEPVGVQKYEFKFTGPQSFLNEIAPARTFGFMRDIERLQRAGLAAGGRLDNFIMIGPDGVVNTTLRFPEELARHKILDIMGDLFLLGRPLRAHVKASMTGHFDNVKILSLLREKISKN